MRTQIYGSSNLRLRLGVAVRHAGYALGVSREESANGLAPIVGERVISALGFSAYLGLAMSFGMGGQVTAVLLAHAGQP